jgi:hypothetical protein
MITSRKLRAFFQSQVVVVDQRDVENGAFVHSLEQY